MTAFIQHVANKSGRLQHLFADQKYVVAGVDDGLFGLGHVFGGDDFGVQPADAALDFDEFFQQGDVSAAAALQRL